MKETMKLAQTVIIKLTPISPPHGGLLLSSYYSVLAMRPGLSKFFNALQGVSEPAESTIPTSKK